MKRSMNATALVGIFALSVVLGLSANSFAQKALPKCRAQADQIYFVDSGQQVSNVRPGGNGYQLNIIGTGADKFSLISEPHMASVSLISNYTNASQAKWQVYFNPNMGREITSVKMRSECTGRTVNDHALTVNVVLRDQ